MAEISAYPFKPRERLSMLGELGLYSDEGEWLRKAMASGFDAIWRAFKGRG
ncbi:hypothetical protein DyAD56_13975 [Dyella sp. AD56]|nr:hypothetical protein DyAD56_13975 [Dyella sp. AD56]